MTGLRTTVALALAGGALAGPSIARGEPSSSVPGAASFPESVTIVPGTSTFFVSSFFTGAVVRGTVGQPAEPFLPAGGDGRRSASGIRADAHGHLLVIAGGLGRLQTYDTASGRLRSTLAVRGPSHINDLVVTKPGDVYITDFGSPAIYRVTAHQLATGRGTIARWLAPERSIVPELGSGGNLNGIAATADGRHLIVGQTGNGALYRVDVATRKIVRIKVTGGSLTGSDGILLQGRTLSVATHGNAVLRLALNARLSRARVTEKLTDPSLNVPSSVAAFGNGLLVSNASKAAGAPDYSLTTLP
jgi:Cu-Zn family superoxide dismutase